MAREPNSSPPIMKRFIPKPGQLLGLIAMLTVFSIPFLTARQPESPPVADTRKQPGPELTEIIFNHVRAGNAAALQLYLDSGYTPNAINARGDSLLVLAAYKSQPEIVKLLLSQPGTNVNFQNKMGFTALTGASFKGETAIMKQLIAAGANVNQRNLSGQTALMFAALTGRFDAVKMLLGYKADAKAVDASGNTAAALAHQQGAEDVAQVLR